MALTPSNMVDLDAKAPEFELPCPASGQRVALSDIVKTKGLLVMFLCNHGRY